MQRANNNGGPNRGLWPVDMSIGAAGGTYTNPNGRTHQNPVSLWKSGSSGVSGISGTNMDQTTSFLGTEQWGRESGGAPWGAATPSEPTTTATSEEADGGNSIHSNQNVFGHVTDSWLSSQDQTSAFHRRQPEEEHAPDVLDFTQTSKSPLADENNDSAHKLKTKSNSRDSSPIEGEIKVENQQMTQSKTSHNALLQEKDKTLESNENDAENSESDVTAREIPPHIVPADHANQTDPTLYSLQENQQISSETGAIAGTIDQLQQLNLMDSYAAQQQQQNIAAQLSNYQLAVQQQYAIPAQHQQQLAVAGMFLPNSYIIPAQAGVSGYADPNSATAAATASQFPMLPQYTPYPGWPPAGMYPAMLQQQMQAAVAAASSQQATSQSTTAQVNREASPEAAQSRPDSIASLSQDNNNAAGQPDILSNVAAMQQTNLNMAAMAGYPIMPSAYYDQTGALIINNGRSGGPVRLFAPPVFMSGSQPLMAPQIPGTNGSMLRFNHQQQAVSAANAMYANQQSMNSGSTPVPSMSQSYSATAPPAANFGSNTSLGGLGIGALGAGMAGSTSSTPQRRDSFSEYPKHPYTGISHFYNSLGMSPGGGAGGGGTSGMNAMTSPSPGPLSHMMMGSAAAGHHLKSPPPSISSPTSNVLIGAGGNRMFSAAPGAEAKYRNGSLMTPNVFGSSGSSLFPPTRIRPPNTKDLVPGRSKLLDDFRNNRLPNPQLHELVNHIVEFSQDQHGSRFIQQKLERATLPEKQHVFNEIIVAAYQLMTDVFGNYVIQKFFEFGSKEQKLALANCIHGHVLPLALQMYGCRVIQKALECIPQEQQVNIVKELNGHLLKCVKDQNGNHVVQKCIECVPAQNLQFIVDGFKGQVCGLSSHPYGCRVMQRILEHCLEEQTAPILEELHQHTERLVKDQYGNYVIQHILEHGRIENKNQIVAELRGKILTLSQHKFASNVIEKCVSHSSPASRTCLIEEVCQEPDALFIMMKDQYANYVVQKMLDVAEPQQKKLLIHKIRPHILTLRKFTYGKHIITKLEKFFLKSGGGGGSGSTSTSGGGTPTTPTTTSTPASGGGSPTEMMTGAAAPPATWSRDSTGSE